jgi:hypothetical protein
MLRIHRADNTDVPMAELRALRPYWYIATPYSKYPAGLDAAFWEAVRIRAELVRLSIPNFVPIVHSHTVAIEGRFDPRSHALWMEDDQPFIDVAGGLIVVKLEGWEGSTGIALERLAFRKAGKPELWMEWF